MAASLDTFNAHRPRLFAIAYRMLGSRAAAEDVLQDAYVRWRQSDTSELRSTEAWLVTSVTRLSAASPRVVPLSIFGESRVRAPGDGRGGGSRCYDDFRISRYRPTW